MTVIDVDAKIEPQARSMSRGARVVLILAIVAEELAVVEVLFEIDLRDCSRGLYAP